MFPERPTEVQTEAEKIEGWRREQLLDVGFPPYLARRLAGRGDVDLHQAIELVKAGCPHDVAARILL
jgi:hypothetical protein